MKYRRQRLTPFDQAVLDLIRRDGPVLGISAVARAMNHRYDGYARRRLRRLVRNGELRCSGASSGRGHKIVFYIPGQEDRVAGALARDRAAQPGSELRALILQKLSDGDYIGSNDLLLWIRRHSTWSSPQIYAMVNVLAKAGSITKQYIGGRRCHGASLNLIQLTASAQRSVSTSLKPYLRLERNQPVSSAMISAEGPDDDYVPKGARMQF